ncbi:MAG: hypothetical protein U0326_00910 [Polyangiales bacterium]
MTPLRLVLALALAACSAPQRIVDDGTAVPLGLTNRASETVCYLFLSTPGEDRWGDDLLGSATIEPGTTRSVRIPRGFWDLRTENCQHELMGVMRSARITRATTLVVQ